MADEVTKGTAPLGLLEGLAQCGYRDHFVFKKGKVWDADRQEFYERDALAIDGIFRFEGPSDPDNMSVVYALSAESGGKGVLIDAYGPYADSELSDFLNSVEDRREASTIFETYPVARSYAIS